MPEPNPRQQAPATAASGQANGCRKNASATTAAPERAQAREDDVLGVVATPDCSISRASGDPLPPNAVQRRQRT